MSKSVEIDNQGMEKESSLVLSSASSDELLSDAQNNPIIFGFNDNYGEVPGRYGLVDDMHTIFEEGLEEERRTAEAKTKIGTIVRKWFHGRMYMGNIVGYDGKKNRFQVVYEEGSSGHVDWNELDRIVAPADLVDTYIDNIMKRQQDEEEEPIRKKRKSVFMDHRNRKGKKQPKPKKDRRTSKRVKSQKAGAKAPYVPLAYGEKKKDIYYWY